MSCRNPKKACAECVFNRKCEPGALGGSDVTVYIGQVYAPFSIPCHLHCDFNDPEWKMKAGPGQTPQCAGTATFRANLGMNEKRGTGKAWDTLLTHEPDHETCFSSYAEFMAHHTGMTVEEAEVVLSKPYYTPVQLAYAELNKANVRKI